MKYPYIVKVKHGKYLQLSTFRVSFRDINKPTGRTLGGLFTEVKHAGWDKARIVLRPASIHAGEEGERNVTRRATGEPGGFYSYYPMVPSTAAGVKSVVRRLRDEEGVELLRVDASIALALDEVRRLRQQRKDIIAKAWTKGHVVRLQDVLPAPGETSRIVG